MDGIRHERRFPGVSKSSIVEAVLGLILLNVCVRCAAHQWPYAYLGMIVSEMHINLTGGRAYVIQQ